MKQNKIKLLSLFSGIGAFEKALDKLKIPYELVNYCEIDKYASKSYAAIHNVLESKNLGDITKVDTSKLPKDIDLITYGFPCQDISVAGKQKGFSNNGECTRSGLFFEALRIIEDTKPRITIAENVKNLVSKKFKNEFEIVLSSLENAGYNNYWQILNAKDYGIPQNRGRVFIVSIRKDVDKGFEFPKPFELELRLKDMLEDEVDEKYYLSDKMINCFMSNGTGKYPRRERFLANINRENQDIANSVTTLAGNRATDNFVVESGNTYICIPEKTKKGYAETEEGDGVYINRPHQKRGVVQKGMIQTLKTNPDVGVVVEDTRNMKEILCDKLIEDDLVEEGDVIRHSYTKNRLNNGVENMGRTESKDKLCPTLDTRCDCLGVVVKDKNLWTDTQKQMITDDGNVKRYIDSEIVDEFKEGQVGDISFPNGYNKGKRVHDECSAINGTTTQSSFITKESQSPLRIRKLTPKECWRLMGFDDEDYDKAAKEISNTQLYKQAGNSIVVDVLEHIFFILFKGETNENNQQGTA